MISGAIGKMLGYAAVLVIAGIAIVALAVPDPMVRRTVLSLGQLWAASILIFLGGVRRGLTLALHAEPRLFDIAVSLVLFVLGLAAIVAPPVPGLLIAILGWITIAGLGRELFQPPNAPDYLPGLRKTQTLIAAISLAVLFGVAWSQPRDSGGAAALPPMGGRQLG